MAEHLITPVHPLEAWRPALAALSEALAPALSLTVEPDVAALDVRLVPGEPVPSEVLDGPLPSLGTWTATADGQAFRLGPDEWLVTSTIAHAPAWEATAIAALRPHGGTATDVSAQRTGVRVRGDRARELLRHGCALDLRPRSFPPGACAQTLVGQVGVLIAAHPADSTGDDLQVLARTSFAGYLADRLLDAADAFRPEETPEEIR